jgi:putative Mg2+ transporter-C (MgtC) family protein
MVLREVTYFAVVLRILTAVIVGGALGLERGMKNRPAGLRTYMLVCVGSCLIMLTNQYLWQVSQAGDPMRLGAQVVSGIGFLGAGTIIVTKHNQIKGLTTAAGLWAAAGVGLALGIGFYEAALTAGFFVFFILTVIQKWDDKMRRKTKVMELYIEYSDDLPLGALIRQLRELDVEIDGVELEHDTIPDDGVRALITTLKTQKRYDHEKTMAKIRKIEGVVYLEEL